MPETMTDETRVPAYELPEVLRDGEGRIIDTAQAWRAWRPGLVQLFETHVYGAPPAEACEVEVVSEPSEAVSAGSLAGRAVRKQYRLRFSRGGQRMQSQVLVYLPASGAGPWPVFMGLNFRGNQTIADDPGIELCEAWVRHFPGMPADIHHGTEPTRGVRAKGWSLEEILDRGYAVATACCGDFDPDFDDGFENAVHALYPEMPKGSWGTIGAWAWGLSRMLDLLENDPAVDARRAVVLGHSRLGKAALWAGARDPRFAAVVSNNSGCGGAAISRRRFGETVAAINHQFPHWFCERFSRYNDREDQLPVDQHQLVALVAPRPVYVASAAEDLWADPRGEYLAAYHASEAYRLFGYPGRTEPDGLAVDQPALGRVSYHLRTGRHGLTGYDWTQYLAFADQQVKPQNP